jgi:hypothetical protein
MLQPPVWQTRQHWRVVSMNRHKTGRQRVGEVRKIWLLIRLSAVMPRVLMRFSAVMATRRGWSLIKPLQTRHVSTWETRIPRRPLTWHLGPGTKHARSCAVRGLMAGSTHGRSGRGRPRSSASPVKVACLKGWDLLHSARCRYAHIISVRLLTSGNHEWEEL